MFENHQPTAGPSRREFTVLCDGHQGSLPWEFFDAAFPKSSHFSHKMQLCPRCFKAIRTLRLAFLPRVREFQLQGEVSSTKFQLRFGQFEDKKTWMSNRRNATSEWKKTNKGPGTQNPLFAPHIAKWFNFHAICSRIKKCCTHSPRLTDRQFAIYQCSFIVKFIQIYQCSFIVTALVHRDWQTGSLQSTNVHSFFTYC